MVFAVVAEAPMANAFGLLSHRTVNGPNRHECGGKPCSSR